MQARSQQDSQIQKHNLQLIINEPNLAKAVIQEFYNQVLTKKLKQNIDNNDIKDDLVILEQIPPLQNIISQKRLFETIFFYSLEEIQIKTNLIFNSADYVDWQKIQVSSLIIKLKQRSSSSLKKIIQNFNKIVLNHLSLDLQNSSLDYESSIVLGKVLAQQTKLRTLNLNLSSIKISVQGLYSVAHSISELAQSLKYLCIFVSQNQLGDPGAKNFGPSISQLKNLTFLVLNFEENAIKSSGALSIGDGISMLSKLQFLHLDMSLNEIRSEEGFYFVSNFKQLVNLQTLHMNLNKCYIKCGGAKDLAIGISRIKGLKFLKLNLDFNQISAIGYRCFEKPIQKLPFLTTLIVSMNDNSFLEKEVKIKFCCLKNLDSLQISCFNRIVLEKNTEMSYPFLQKLFVQSSRIIKNVEINKQVKNYNLIYQRLTQNFELKYKC